MNRFSPAEKWIIAGTNIVTEKSCRMVHQRVSFAALMPGHHQKHRAILKAMDSILMYSSERPG